MGLERQKLAIVKINQYLQDIARKLVVCCRSEEYEKGQVKLDKLYGAYYLKPPTELAIKDYLERLGQENLWQKIQTNNQMEKLATIPLFLNLMITVFQGEAIVSESQLFDNYIEEQLKRPHNPPTYPQGKPPYTPKDTKKWLTYLAGQLEADKSTVFLIENMQPSWLQPGKERLLFQFCFWLISGGIFGLIIWLSFFIIRLYFGFILGLKWWFLELILYLIYGLILWLIFGMSFGNFKKYKIQTGTFKFDSPIILITRLSNGLRFGLIYGSILGIILWPFFGLFYWLSFGLSFGLIIGLIAKLNGEIKFSEKPNEGIKETLNKALIIFLISSPLAMLILPLLSLFTGEYIHWIVSVIFGLLTGSIMSLFTAVQDFIKHLTLRLILWQQGLIPRNYARFLCYAEERKLIQIIGGRYLFLHDSLRKHFANKEPIPKRII